MLIAIAGPSPAAQTIEPFLKGVISRETIYLGDDIKRAGLLKATGNFITAALLETIAEAHVLAEKTGLGCDNLEKLIEENYGPYAHGISKRMTSGAYVPRNGEKATSDLNLEIKDVSIVMDYAERSGVKLEVAELAMRNIKETKRFGEAEMEGRAMDSSSVYGTARRAAGLDFENDLVKQREAPEDAR